MNTRAKLSSLALWVALGLLAAACGGESPAGPDGASGPRSAYVLSGSSSSSEAPLYIDDFIRVFVDGKLIGQFDGCMPGLKSCNRLPIHFEARPGSELRIEGGDRGGSYGLDDLFLYKNGLRMEQLFAGFRCNSPSLECPTPFADPVIYMTRSFTLP
jgi:hypothetical protein